MKRSLEGLYPPVRAPLGEVTTGRLWLRRPRPDDLEELVDVFAELEVWRFPYGRGLCPDETAEFLDSQIHAWEACGFGLWMVRTPHDARLIGFVGLSVPTFLPEILPAVEVGWRFHPDVWGQGYATEGARAALDQAFTTLGLPRVCSVPQATNPASYRVCERLGMCLERRVTLPPNDRRGSLEALLYTTDHHAWPKPS